jgi:methionine-rich copper-binding protein CopC
LLTLIVRAVAVALAATFVNLVVLAGQAVAHTDLETSAPADTEVLTEPAEVVTLSFAEALQPDFTQVAVTGPDGQSVSSGPATIDGPVVRQPVSLGADGSYVIAYRVVSGDGHPVAGQLGFTYTGPDARGVEPTPTGSPQSTQEASAAEDEGSTSEWSLWWGVIAWGAAAMSLQVALLLFLRHRESHRGDD